MIIWYRTMRNESIQLQHDWNLKMIYPSFLTSPHDHLRRGISIPPRAWDGDPRLINIVLFSSPRSFKTDQALYGTFCSDLKSHSSLRKLKEPVSSKSHLYSEKTSYYRLSLRKRWLTVSSRISISLTQIDRGLSTETKLRWRILFRKQF
jgi:hypothetical protein